VIDFINADMQYHKAIILKEEIKQGNRVVEVVIGIKKKIAKRKPAPQTRTVIKNNMLELIDMLESAEFENLFVSMETCISTLKHIMYDDGDDYLARLGNCYAFGEECVEGYENQDSKYCYDLQEMTESLKGAYDIMDDLPDVHVCLDGINVLRDKMFSTIENIHQLLCEMM
jgi:hypothetical protein